MAINKNINIAELAAQYDESFIQSISLANVSSSKELKELVSKLETANYVMTSFYQMIYNDFIMSINSTNAINTLDEATIKKYKSITSRIQKAYNYILYMFTFENPFKVSK